jgi:transglutaminase-like putative cysteine protease
MQTDPAGTLSDTGSYYGNDSGTTAAYAYAARYLYSEVVVRNDNLLRLTPPTDSFQTRHRSELRTQPRSLLERTQDKHGNITHKVEVRGPHKELVILTVGLVRLETPPQRPAEVALASLPEEPWLERFLSPTPLVHPAQVVDKAREIVGASAGLLEAVEAINHWIYRKIRYIQGSTTLATTSQQVLESRAGVCQDMTHLALGMLRGLKIPARYVCGLMAPDVGETHAWMEFRHPRLGWIPADPSRGLPLANRGDIIKFAVGRDFSEAAPVEGTFKTRGSGHLDSAVAQVQLGRDFFSFDDALRLLPPTADGIGKPLERVEP